MATNIDKALTPLMDDSSDILIEENQTLDVDVDLDVLDLDAMGEEEMEDGSVVIDFDPEAELREASEAHGVNLAEHLSDQELTAIGTELVQDFKDAHATRAPWYLAHPRI